MPPAFDFPEAPPTGTTVTMPDNSYRTWDGIKWRAAPSAGRVSTDFLPLAGGTLTGPLTLAGDATQPLHPVSYQQMQPLLFNSPYVQEDGGAPMTGPLTLSGNATQPLHAVPLQQLTSAVAGAGVGTFLPLTGGTVSGPTTFQGTTTHGTASSNYWTIGGSSGSPAITVTGSGNLSATLQGLGSFGALLRSSNGTVLRADDSGGTVGNFLRVTAATAGNPLTLVSSDNNGGIQFQSPVQGNYNWTYSGLFSANANKPLSFINTIHGASTNTVQFPISQIRNIYSGFRSGMGAYGLMVTGEVDAGSIMRTNVVLRAAGNQTAQPGIVAAWTGSTAYAAGAFSTNGGKLYQVLVAGTSAASGGPTGNGASIVDGTVTWQYCDQAYAAQYQVSLGVLSTANYNVGGVAGAAVGNNFGAVIGAGLQSASTFYNQNVVMELDDFVNAGCSVNRAATLQLVKGGAVQGTYQDWGISFASAGAKWKNPLLFQGAVDPNGYAIAFMDQNSGGSQTMAGALDMRMVRPTGNGPFGGGFFMGWPSGSLDSAGNINLGYARLAPTATGVSLDVALQHCTAAAIVSGGTNWTDGMWAADQNGNFVTVTTSSGVVTAATLQIAGYVATPPGGAQTFTALHPATGTLGPTGGAIRATPFTATLTYAAATTPTLSLQPSGGTVQVGSGCVAANGSVATVLGSLGPTGSHTTVQEWFAIKNASGVTRYIPAF